MKVFSWARAMVVTLGISAALLLTAMACTNAFSANDSPVGEMPDVLMWIDVRNPDAHWVSITYPKVVTRDVAESYLGKLLTETGWSATNVSITEGSVVESGENPMTAVEFMTPAAVRPYSGLLPIEPIVKAFRDLKNIEIQYLVPPTFYFQGLGDYENEYVKIVLNHGNNAYRYTIRVKNSKFDTLGLPSPNVGEPFAENSGRWGRISGLVVRGLIVMLALMVATLAYIITSRFTGKGR